MQESLSSSTKTVFYIAGPTASGKSAYALALAQEKNGIIINADSMQVYESLDIITARPSPQDLKKCPHKLYGHIKDPNDPYDVAKWRMDALNGIDQAFHEGKTPLIVGGTGLYAKALFEGLSEIPDVDPDIRTKVRNLPHDDLHKMLAEKDPEAALALKTNDVQRRTRALEVVLSSGQTLKHWQHQKGTPLAYPSYKILMNPPREICISQAEKRLRYMFDNGAIEEVEALMSIGIHDASPLYKAVGVREIGAYLRGEISLEKAFELSLIATRQYIKRQQTWFKNQMDFDEVLL